MKRVTSKRINCIYNVENIIVYFGKKRFMTYCASYRNWAFVLSLLIITLSSTMVFGQKSVIIKSPIIYQGYPIDTIDVISIQSIETGSDAVWGSAVTKQGASLQINLQGNASYDLRSNYSNLIFKHNNTSRGSCITYDFSFTVDLTRSTADVLYLENCIIVNQQFYFASNTYCQGEREIAPVTDIPSASIELLAPAGIVFDADNNLLPCQSLPGYYEVPISSDYCINYGNETLSLTITSLSKEDFLDTLVFCDNGMNQMLPVSDYKLFPLPGGISQDPVDIPQTSAYYLAQSYSSACAPVDTVYIQLSEAGTLEILQSEECESVVLSAQTSGSPLTSYLWFNGSTNAVTDTPESGEVWLVATNQDACNLTDTLIVSFEPLTIEAVDYTLTHAGCWNEGAIEIVSLTTNQPAAIAGQALYNTVKKNNVSDLGSVPEGAYKFEIINQEGCKAYSLEEIIVLQTCLEEYPVFTPNSDGVEDEYFIPHVGSIQIFDRNGSLLRKIETPAYWDGRDDSGHLLPMGNYLMITNTNKAVNITIVR